MKVQAALKYFRQTHLEYLWLHFLVAVVLVVTSVFWFVLPYFMISYGQYSITIIGKLLMILALFLLPSMLLTLHCWFINFQAALKWKRIHPQECVWRTLFKFQSRTIIIVIIFTSIIYSILFIIDMIRS
ncbi:MAG: hypothetical protein ABS944_03765 [Solibacillus sp.]|jgi:hypothetical protein